jgi:hypothetical protein
MLTTAKILGNENRVIRCNTKKKREKTQVFSRFFVCYSPTINLKVSSLSSASGGAVLSTPLAFRS